MEIKSAEQPQMYVYFTVQIFIKREIAFTTAELTYDERKCRENKETNEREENIHFIPVSFKATCNLNTYFL